MKACSAATSPTSKRKRITPNGSVNHAERRNAERHRESPAMNRMIRWPARMLANRRIGERDQPHRGCESTSRRRGSKPRHRARLDAARDPALEVAERPLRRGCPRRVGDEHERAPARAGSRGSRSPRRARTTGCAQPKRLNCTRRCWSAAGCSRRRFEKKMNRNSVRDEREPASPPSCGRCCCADDVVLQQPWKITSTRRSARRLGRCCMRRAT